MTTTLDLCRYTESIMLPWWFDADLIGSELMIAYPELSFGSWGTGKSKVLQVTATRKELDAALPGINRYLEQLK